MATTFTFDGDNKKIYMNTDVPDNSTITVDIVDIYSEWKRWCVNGDGLKYHHAFEVIGGEPISDTTRTGTYIFMQPGWTGVPPDKDNMTVIIEGNLFPSVVGDPVMTPRPDKAVSLIMRNSSLTQTVTINSGSGLSQEEHDKLMSLPTADINADSVWNHSERTLTQDISISEEDIHNYLDSYANKDNWKADVSNLLTKDDERLDNLDERISTRLGSDDVRLNHLDADISSRKPDVIDFTETDRTKLNSLQNYDDTELKSMINTMLDVLQGDWEVKDNQMIFYDRNGNELMRFNLFNQIGQPTMTDIFKRTKI